MARRSWSLRQIIEILEHWQSGRSIKSIAKSLGVDRKTVRKYICGVLESGVTQQARLDQHQWAVLLLKLFPELDHAQRSPSHSLLNPLESEIRQALAENKVVTVWRRKVYPVLPDLSLSSFRRWLRDVMPELSAESKVTVWRPEVPPGEEAQIDFGYMGMWTDPVTSKRVRVWAFIMVLSHSRHMFVCPVFRMDSCSWLQCHIEAFEFFGSVPKRLVLDNLKAGVIKPDIYDPEVNREYARLARHYGAIVDPCRSQHAKDKPRVERQVPFVRESMWTGLSFGNVKHMRQHCRDWCLEEAGSRIHGTTRWKPLEYYEQNERQYMLALPPSRFEVFEWTQAKVAQDSHCQVKRARYSVPFLLLGRTLEVRVGEKVVEFYHGDNLVKTHVRRHDRGTSTDLGDLPEEKTAFFMHTPQVCLKQAGTLGTAVHDVVLSLLNQGAFTHLRQAQGVLGLVKKHGAERLNTACQMALRCDDPNYRTVKRILDKGLDLFDQRYRPDKSAQVGAYLHGSNAFQVNTSSLED